MKSLSDTCRDKAPTVGSSPFFYTSSQSGSPPKRRHHSQVRMRPWTTFFNRDSASNKLTAATLRAKR